VLSKRVNNNWIETKVTRERRTHGSRREREVRGATGKILVESPRCGWLFLGCTGTVGTPLAVPLVGVSKLHFRPSALEPIRMVYLSAMKRILITPSFDSANGTAVSGHSAFGGGAAESRCRYALSIRCGCCSINTRPASSADTSVTCGRLCLAANDLIAEPWQSIAFTSQA
jgi:hypothetical protein